MLSVIVMNSYNFQNKAEEENVEPGRKARVYCEPLIFVMVRLTFVELGTSKALETLS